MGRHAFWDVGRMEGQLRDKGKEKGRREKDKDRLVVCVCEWTMGWGRWWWD
jgi:hypothetical protein